MKTAYYPYKTVKGRFSTFHIKETSAFAQARKEGGTVYRHNPYVTPDHADENGQWEKMESPSIAQKPRYRKNSIEAKLDSLLPEYPSFDVIAHELWADGEGSWSVNESWHLARGCDREEAIGHLVNRWHVFKANYYKRAAWSRLEDANWSGPEFPALLEVDCIPFAEVRNGGEE